MAWIRPRPLGWALVVLVVASPVGAVAVAAPDGGPAGAAWGANPVGATPSPPAAVTARPDHPLASPRATPGRFRWPLDGPPRILRAFRPPARPWLAGHRGVDLAAEVGAVVRSAGDGVVHFAGRVAGRGVVSVRHADGLRTTYEPVTVTVRAGERVRAGAPLGVLASGHAGCPRPCLHWGLRDDQSYLDPLSLLGLGRVRLLPLADASGQIPGRPPHAASLRRSSSGSLRGHHLALGSIRREGGPAGRRRGVAPRRRGCRAEWWRGTRGRAAPARLGDRRRPRGDGSRPCAGARGG